YRAQIGDDGQGVTWTAPYTQGYNNLDIGYTYGAKIQYFTVSFEGNGGSVLADDSTRSVRGGQALADAMPPAPERSQYIFTAWNSKVDGSGTEFTASTVVTANITLYAQWREQTYTVSYAPGDHGLFETITYPSLSAQTATPAPPLTPGAPGWVFAGWSPTPTATVDGDVTYVAQWRLAVYTVTFVDHDATELSVQQVEHGSNAILPANPVWVDYQFAGWNQAHTNVQNDLIIQALYARLPDVHPVEMLIVEVGQPEPGQAWPAAGDDQWTANADQPETSSPLSSPSLLAVPPAVLPTEPGPEVTDAENFSLEVSAELLTLDNLLNGGRVHEAADQQTDGTTWALFNLLLALLGLLLAAVIVGWKLLQRYRWSQAAPGAPAASWRLDALLRSGGALLALLLAAGLGLALFLVTADLAGPMVLVDNWTVLQLGSTLVVLGLALLTLRQSAGWKAWEAAD
ncbi:MAG: InlB B-repeat-containing protein, partial [Actinomycetia bacterium]|nr:InlB B-repeat-containing protein [Actinomycetes bacterium]